MLPWRALAWTCMLGGGAAAAWGLWLLWRIRNEASVGFFGRLAHLLWLDRIHEHRDLALGLVAGGLAVAGFGLGYAVYLRWCDAGTPPAPPRPHSRRRK
jgi:hypothetical protein